nr:immunoglobulin heavy chain junction region [Macaca mulatta]
CATVVDTATVYPSFDLW